jgi:hypothetical protein
VAFGDIRDQELRAITERLRSLDVRPDQLTIERWDDSQVLVSGSYLERLDPKYGTKLTAEAVFRTHAISMDYETVLESLDRLVSEWKRDD